MIAYNQNTLRSADRDSEDPQSVLHRHIYSLISLHISHLLQPNSIQNKFKEIRAQCCHLVARDLDGFIAHMQQMIPRLKDWQIEIRESTIDEQEKKAALRTYFRMTVKGKGSREDRTIRNDLVRLLDLTDDGNKVERATEYVDAGASAVIGEKIRAELRRLETRVYPRVMFNFSLIATTMVLTKKFENIGNNVTSGIETCMPRNPDPSLHFAGALGSEYTITSLGILVKSLSLSSRLSMTALDRSHGTEKSPELI